MSSSSGDPQAVAVSIAQAWFAAQSGGQGIANAGLMMAHHFALEYPLEEAQFLTQGGGQISLIGGDRIKRIIEAIDPTLPSASEGGRTSRGTVGAARDLASRLNSEPVFARLAEAERRQAAAAIQRWLVTGPLRELANRERIKPDYDLTATALVNIRAILQAANQRKVLGCVAQHLVGAKLQLRFPAATVPGHGCSAADAPTGRQGDFELEDSVFHVTVAPASRLIDKCNDNVRRGLRPFVVVPTEKTEAVVALLEEAGIERSVTVYPLDTFLAQNIDELSEFSSVKSRDRIRELVNEYNARVDRAEPNKFLMLKMPGGR
jgi:hypothetical protein